MAEDTMVKETEERDLTADGMEGQQTTDAGGEGPEPAVALKNELEQVRGERDQLLDRLARLQAEFDNARKRRE